MSKQNKWIVIKDSNDDNDGNVIIDSWKVIVPHFRTNLFVN